MLSISIMEAAAAVLPTTIISADIGEHVADPVVPLLHRPVEPEVCLGWILEVQLHLLELRPPVLGINESGSRQVPNRASAAATG